MEQKRGKYVIPVGYVFRPEPEELLRFLVESIKLGDQWVQPPEIRNVDLYDKDSNPWTLFGGSSEQPFYVMTRLTKMASGNGKSNKKRKVGAVGTWKLQKSTEVAFRCQDGVELKGLKRNFAFLPDKDCGYSREEHGHWIMNEYSLLQEGLQDYVICEIHMKPSSKRKLDDDDDDDTHKNQVVMKKMRSTASSSTTTYATSGHDDGDGVVKVEVANEDDMVPSHQEVLMKKTQSSSNTCDDDDNRKLNDSIKSAVEEVWNDIVASRSLAPAPVADSDHDRQGMISMIQSVDPFEGHDHLHYPPSLPYDHDRDSVVKTDSCVPTKQSYPPPFDFPDDFWDFPGADLPVHWQEPATSTCDYLGSLVVDGSDDPMTWDGSGFNFSGLEEVSPAAASVDFYFIGLRNY